MRRSRECRAAIRDSYHDFCHSYRSGQHTRLLLAKTTIVFVLPIIRVSGNSVAAMISASYGDRIHVEFSGLRFRFSTLEREFGLPNCESPLPA